MQVDFNFGFVAFAVSFSSFFFDRLVFTINRSGVPVLCVWTELVFEVFECLLTYERF